jgi:predicted small lipoprotein YifL
MNPRRRRACTLLASGVLIGISGCGQKGPLYLPDAAPQAVPAPRTAAPPPAATAVPPADDEATRRKTPRIPEPATAQ